MPRRIARMLNRSDPRPGRPRGFTLIELLVVISIIALLIGILIPALGKARESSRRVKCLANLKGIGVGVSIYMQDVSKGILPLVRPLNDGSNTNDPSLLDILSDYTDSATPFKRGENDWVVADPWLCPSDRGGRDEATNFVPLWQSNGTSYEYVAGQLMLAAELFFVRDPQRGVHKAYENNQDMLVLVDADDWHNPRYESGGFSALPDQNKYDRNGLFFGDWRADKAPFADTQRAEKIFADIVRFGGGIGG